MHWINLYPMDDFILIRRIVIYPVVYSPVRLMFEQLRPVNASWLKKLLRYLYSAKKTLTLLIINIYLKKVIALELIIINLVPADTFPCPLSTEQS